MDNWFEKLKSLIDLIKFDRWKRQKKVFFLFNLNFDLCKEYFFEKRKEKENWFSLTLKFWFSFAEKEFFEIFQERIFISKKKFEKIFFFSQISFWWFD